MEKKKLERIIGILIVVALVIIVIPLVFTNSTNRQAVSQPEEAAQLTVPTVPDQQTANPEIASNSNTVENANNSLPSTEANSANAALPTTNTDNTNNTTITKAPATALDTQLQAITSSATDVNTNNINNNSNNSNPSNTASPQLPQQLPQTETPNTQPSQATVRYIGDTVEVTPAPVSANNNASDAIDKNINNNTVEITPAIAEDMNRNSVAASNIASNNRDNPITSAVVKTDMKTNIKTKSHAVVKNSFVKKSAWVIQMGSFRNKSNAHRLVSQLKTVGFKAFTHEIKSSSGNAQTRVYVGPEFKEASAKKLSTRVTKEMHIRGFIVPYKPMVF